MFLLWWDTTKCLQLILEHGRVQTPLESVQFLNKHHLFGGCFVLLHLCIPLLLTLPSQLMHFVHRLPAPHLQRLRSRRWSEALRHARWRAQRSSAALSALQSPWWLTVESSPPLYCAPPSLLSVMWGVRVECWQYELISIPNTSC